MPAFFSVLPYVLTMMAWCPDAKTIMGGTVTVLISFGVMAFISSLISNYGNKRQEKLYELWGAAPSTLILRHSNQVLSKYTKARYPPMSTYLSPEKFSFRRQKWHLPRNLKYNL